MIISQFYKGISEIELTEYLKANRSFKKVMNDNDNLYKEQAEWYSGLCYLMLDSVDQAKEQFKKIAQKDSYYKDEALDILLKLDD